MKLQGILLLSLRVDNIPNLSLLEILELLEKFLCAGGGWVVCKPILVCCLSLDQAEKYL